MALTDVVGGNMLPASCRTTQVVLEKADQRVRMYLIMHHALYDAKSLQCILENLARSLRKKALISPEDPATGLSEIMRLTRSCI